MKKKRLLTDRGAGMQLPNIFDADMWEKQELVRLLKGVPGTYYQEASDENKAVMRNWISDLLHTQKITVSFVKSDGSNRDMNCTLDPKLIPQSAFKSTTQRVDGLVQESKKSRGIPKEPDPAVVKVYDLDAGAWRSFRMDRLKTITATLNFQ